MHPANTSTSWRGLPVSVSRRDRRKNDRSTVDHVSSATRLHSSSCTSLNGIRFSTANRISSGMRAFDVGSAMVMLLHQQLPGYGRAGSEIDDAEAIAGRWNTPRSVITSETTRAVVSG